MALKDKKTKITFHNGVLTIGGTIIEIEYEDSHIFFDFGSEYHPEANVQPEDLQGLLDASLIPYLHNVYDPSIPLKGYASTPDHFKHTAVFLSHVHLDHSKAINYLHPRIPLYTLQATKSLLNTLNINNDFLFTRQDESEITTRDMIGVSENEEVTIGDLRVKLMPVDHDAYGACGLIIHTPDTTIAYTGDIRLHGYRKDQTLRFCKEAYHCDVLIMEGVSISFQTLEEALQETTTFACKSEQDLLSEVCRVVEEHKDKQITFNYYISNIERILQMMNAVSRTLVVSAYAAYTIKEASGKEAFYYQLDEKTYGLDPAKRIDFQDLLEDESTYLWQLDGQALTYMDKLKKEGVYIHSNAQPLGEFDPAYAPFMKKFEDHGIKVVSISCSGHAHVPDLFEIIDRIEPKLLTPIHSLHPERFTNKGGEMILPQKKQTI